MEIQTPNKTSESEIENSTNDYLTSLGITITKTWLLIYSTIIRILNLLVSISLSYEKHALSFLRALSIIALVICCTNRWRFLVLGGQDSVDSIISIILLPTLIFNTNFDLYKRTVVILVVKVITMLVEYLIVAVVSGRSCFGE